MCKTRHIVQIGPVWINSPLVLQERYDATTQQYVFLFVCWFRFDSTTQHPN